MPGVIGEYIFLFHNEKSANYVLHEFQFLLYLIFGTRSDFHPRQIKIHQFS